MKWGVTKNSVRLSNTSLQFHQTAKSISPVEFEQGRNEMRLTEHHCKEVWRARISSPEVNE